MRDLVRRCPGFIPERNLEGEGEGQLCPYRVHLILTRVSVSSVQRPLQTGIPDFPAALGFDLGHRNCDWQPGRSAAGMSA